MPELNTTIDWSDLDSSLGELAEYLTDTYDTGDIIQYLDASHEDFVVNADMNIDAWVEALDGHYGRDVFKRALAQFSSDLAEHNEDAVYKFIEDCSDMNTLLMIMSAVIRRLLTGACS